MLLMWDVMALTISCGKIIFRAFLPPTYFAHCRVVRSAMVRASGCEGFKGMAEAVSTTCQQHRNSLRMTPRLSTKLRDASHPAHTSHV